MKICRILNIYKKLYGEDDERVGMTLCSLAHVKCAKGDVYSFSYIQLNSFILYFSCFAHVFIYQLLCRLFCHIQAIINTKHRWLQCQNSKEFFCINKMPEGDSD